MRLKRRKLRTIDGIEEHDGLWKGEIYIFSLTLPLARNEYACDGCGEPIPKGCRHVTFTTRDVESPSFEHWRLHGECYLSDGVMFDTDRPSWRWASEGQTETIFDSTAKLESLVEKAIERMQTDEGK